jgi:hypothetical protein
MMMITTEHSGDKGVCPATSHATSLSAMSHPGCCPERRRDAAAWRLFSAPLRCCLAFIFGPIKLLMYHMLISHIMHKKTNVHPRTHAEKPHVRKMDKVLSLQTSYSHHPQSLIGVLRVYKYSMVISLLIIIPPVKITSSMLERGHSYSVGGFNYINHRPLSFCATACSGRRGRFSPTPKFKNLKSRACQLPTTTTISYICI